MICEICGSITSAKSFIDLCKYLLLNHLFISGPYSSFEKHSKDKTKRFLCTGVGFEESVTF